MGKKRRVVLRMTEADSHPRFFVDGTSIELAGVQNADLEWDGTERSYSTGSVTFLLLSGTLLDSVRDNRDEGDE